MIKKPVKPADLIKASDLMQLESKIQKKRLKALYSFSNKNIKSYLPVEKKLIILIDIVGFSKKDTYSQWQGIMVFQQYLRTRVIANCFLKKIHVSHFIPTGDGCYIIADECKPEVALDFVYSIVKGFQNVQPQDEYELSLRASALLGDAVPFMDLAMHKNYIGEGMNEGNRVLSGGQKALEDLFVNECEKEGRPSPQNEEIKSFSRNSVFVDDSLSQYVEKFSRECKIYSFKDVADKHDKTRNITALQGIH